MTAQHTPGPWRQAKKNSRHIIAGKVDGLYPVIAEVRAAHDISLIAAAPDLLAALEKMRDWAERYVPFSKGHVGLQNDLYAADNAIAKART